MGKWRPIQIDGDVGRVALTNGMVALIDAADAELVGRYTWQAHPSGQTWYAKRGRARVGDKEPRSMHRLLMRPPADLVVDHINGDGLDNRRANLRICTQRENLQNRRPTILGTPRGGTGVRGVYRLGDSYVTRITVDGASLDLARGEDPKELGEVRLWAYGVLRAKKEPSRDEALALIREVVERADITPGAARAIVQRLCGAKPTRPTRRSATNARQATSASATTPSQPASPPPQGRR